jgi:glyoxylase I family protein
MVHVSVQKLSHIVLHVSDMERSLKFYRDILGLEVAFETNSEDLGDGAAAMTAGGGGFRVVGCLVRGGMVLELTEGMSTAIHDGADDSYIIALSVSDIEEAHGQIIEAGVSPLMPPMEVVPGIKMFFVQDPDGRQIEFVEFPGDANSSAEYNEMGSNG